MVTREEIEAFVSKVEKNLIWKYERELYRIGAEGLIEFLRERGGLKDDPQKPTGPTVMVRLPVVVYPDMLRETMGGICGNRQDEDVLFHVARRFCERRQSYGGVVHIVTAELPIPQKPVPVEVQGEVETQ